MDREFKFLVGFILFLAAVATVLLQALGGVAFLSREYLSGFIPFLLLLAPYILFSSGFLTALLRDLTFYPPWKKLLFPLYLLAAYISSSLIPGNFQWALLLKLAGWVFVPTIFFLKTYEDGESASWREAAAAVALWLPIEFGWLAGFDLLFTPGITVPALAFAAPVLGLYLFVVVRNLPDVGYSFRIGLRDLSWALAGLAVLAVFLVPLGTRLGFIAYSTLDVSAFKVMELLFGIYFLVAIPEELLFRGIFQNLLAKAFRFANGRWAALAAASVIFGFSHWNNFDPVDWRYVFLATLAGAVYGWVYYRTGKTTVSAFVHTGVNFIWAVLFKETQG